MKLTQCTKAFAIFTLCTLCLFLFIGCAGSEDRHTIRIAEQFGLAYAPVQVMRLQELIEAQDPSITVEWVQLENTAAIREAIIAGEVDVGFGGIPPFLTGWSAGMEWKIATGLSRAPLGLVTNRDAIRSLADFGPDDAIVVPQPGSIQHILLSMALERQFGDPGYLDTNLVSMSHPNGMQALMNDSTIAGHFTSPPYIFLELEQPGFRQVLTGDEAFGGAFTFIVGSVTRSLHDDRSDLYTAFLNALEAAVTFIRENPQETASMLAGIYSIPPERVLAYLQHPDMEYSTDVTGVMSFARFMHENGYLDQLPETLGEVVWDTP